MELAAPASQADDYLCDASWPAFIYRNRGTRENRDKERQRTCSGLSNVIVGHPYLHLHSLYIALNYRQLADFYTNRASVITLNSMIASVGGKKK